MMLKLGGKGIETGGLWQIWGVVTAITGKRLFLPGQRRPEGRCQCDSLICTIPTP